MSTYFACFFDLWLCRTNSSVFSRAHRTNTKGAKNAKAKAAQGEPEQKAAEERASNVYMVVTTLPLPPRVICAFLRLTCGDLTRAPLFLLAPRRACSPGSKSSSANGTSRLSHRSLSLSGARSLVKSYKRFVFLPKACPCISRFLRPISLTRCASAPTRGSTTKRRSKDHSTPSNDLFRHEASRTTLPQGPDIHSH